MPETRTKSGQNASPVTKNTKRNSKEDETVGKTTPRGRGRPRLDRTETPKQSEDSPRQKEDSSRSRSVRQSLTPASKDKNSVSETTDGKSSTSKRKRLENDTATSKTDTLTKSQEKIGVKKPKLADASSLKDKQTRNTVTTEKNSSQELQGGGDGKNINEIPGRRRKLSSDAPAKVEGQEKPAGGTLEGRGRGRPPGTKRKADDEDAKQEKVDVSGKGDGRKDEDAVLSTPSSEKRGRGRPRKSEVTENKSDNKATDVEMSKPGSATVDKTKPEINLTPTSNTASPRRSGREVVPNRRFKDMDLDLPKKRANPKKSTPQKTPAEGKKEKILNTEESKRSEKDLKKTETKTQKSTLEKVPVLFDKDKNVEEKTSLSENLQPSAVLGAIVDEEKEPIDNDEDATSSEGVRTDDKDEVERMEEDDADLEDKNQEEMSKDNDRKKKTSDVKTKKSELETEQSDSSNTVWSSSRHTVKCIVRDGQRTTTEVIVYPPKKLSNTSQSPHSGKSPKTTPSPIKSSQKSPSSITPAVSTPRVESVSTEAIKTSSGTTSVTQDRTDSEMSKKISEDSIINVWVDTVDNSESLSKISGAQNTIPVKTNAPSKIAVPTEGSTAILKSPTSSDVSGTISTPDVSKLKSVLLEDKGDNLMKSRREEGSTDEIVIVDTPVYIPPSTAPPTKPGKIVKPTADRTICVSVSGKSDNNQENIRNVTVKIPSNYTQNPLPSSITNFRSGIKISSPTRAPQVVVPANQSSQLLITPNQNSPQILASRNQSLSPESANHSYANTLGNQSPSQVVVSTNQSTSRVVVPANQISVETSLAANQSSLIDPIKSSDTNDKSQETTSQTIVIEGDIGETGEIVDKLLEDVENMRDKGQDNLSDTKTPREIKVEPKEATQLVTAETQTPIIENRYKTVIREIGSNKILDPSKCEKGNTEEVIIVELPAGTEVKRELVTQEKPEHPDFVTIDANGLYQCKFCSYNTHKKSNWYKHKNKHFVMRNHQCPHCSYRAATSSNLKRHIGIHSDVRDFHCDICQLNFRQKIHLERHLKYKHEEKTVQCPICPYVCANENPDLKVHIKRRHMPNESVDAFTCEECGLVTVSKKDLRQHMKFHRKGPELKLFCEHCSFVTDCESRLRRHLFIHTKEKPFQCGLCDYRGSQKEHVLRHMKSQHNIEIERERGPRKNNQSATSNDATQEVVISNSNEKADYSSEEKIFACNHCTMKFSKLINLYKHLHTQHRDLMPFNSEEFTCVVCDFRTNNKKNLLVHMRKHNAQDQSPPSHVYSCVLCRYMNPRRRNLFQHMKKKHHIEIVMKDDGTASCSVAENSNVREDGEAGMVNVNEIVTATSQNAEIEIITEKNVSLNLPNMISLEDIAMVVSNPLTNAVNTDPMGSNVTTGSSSVTSVAEHEAAEAIEGLQALAEQAGLVETIVDNVIEEPVHDMTTIAEDNQLFIDEGGAAHHQMIKTEPMPEALGQSIQLSQEQLLNLSSGDYVEINGEMYKVEISSEDKNAVKEEMSLPE